MHFLLQSAGRLDKPLIITANTSVVASVCALTECDDVALLLPNAHRLLGYAVMAARLQ